MNNLNWLIRAARWVRHPPGPGRVALVLAVIAIALAIVGIEQAGLWPDWARLERAPGIRVHRP
jgi:predicted acyltransferase